MTEAKALGYHLIIEVKNADPTRLKNKDKVEQIMCSIAQESGAHIIGSFFHQFQPYGVSGVIIIEESHLSIHTWPEHNYAAIDYFYCDESIDERVAIKLIKEYFKTNDVFIVRLDRGTGYDIPDNKT